MPTENQLPSTSIPVGDKPDQPEEKVFGAGDPAVKDGLTADDLADLRQAGTGASSASTASTSSASGDDKSAADARSELAGDPKGGLFDDLARAGTGTGDKPALEGDFDEPDDDDGSALADDGEPHLGFGKLGDDGGDAVGPKLGVPGPAEVEFDGKDPLDDDHDHDGHPDHDGFHLDAD